MGKILMQTNKTLFLALMLFGQNNRLIWSYVVFKFIVFSCLLNRLDRKLDIFFTWL